jgi:hypothetical protein
MLTAWPTHLSCCFQVKRLHAWPRVTWADAAAHGGVAAGNALAILVVNVIQGCPAPLAQVALKLRGPWLAPAMQVQVQRQASENAAAWLNRVANGHMLLQGR